MRLPIAKHEDERRSLVEWVKDSPVRSCKVLTVKQDAVLGAHYHNNKVDTFYLLKGSGEYKLGEEGWEKIVEGDCIRAEAGVPHSFKLKAGSILLEASSSPFDPSDEHRITN